MTRVMTEAEISSQGQRLVEWAARGEDTMILSADAEPVAVVLSLDRYRSYQTYQQWAERTERFRQVEELATDNPNRLDSEEDAIALVNEERRVMYRERGDQLEP